MKTYASYYDNEIRNNSSSGGMFSLLASQFDIVYGVAMTDDCHSAEYRRIDDGNIASLRGSKYFQARIGDTFKSVKEDLNNKKRVLFSGTGCQINGLKCFLQKDYPNLTTVDIICHGVPSPKLWRDYVSYQEEKHGKLEHVNFRCKDDSRHDLGMIENTMFIPKDNDTFMRFFLRDYCLRPSCYECHAKTAKNSDITIGDFWGIKSVAPEMNDGAGTSLVIVRTERGHTLFENIKAEIKWEEVSYEDAVKSNPAEYKSVKRPPERAAFFADLVLLPFYEVEKKYAADIKSYLTMELRVKNIIKRVVKRFVYGETPIKQNDRYGVLYSFETKN